MNRKIIWRKKGIFFTFIAITIIAIYILVFTPRADISLQKDTTAIKKRISSVDNYVSDLQNRYFEAVLKANSYKTMLSLIFYMNSTKSYIKNFDAAFYEVSLNGTIGNVPIDSITGKKIMENNTLSNWTNRIINTSRDTLNVNTTITINNVSISQTKPWLLESRASINFTIKSNVAEWKKSAIVTTTISIEGLYDPAYLVNTNGLYANQIKKSSVEFNQWNLTRVREHLRNGTYVHWESSDAPSFLMRSVNDTTNSSCCGIESLANPNKLVPSDQIDSYADYLLWNHTYNTRCSGLYNVTGLWDEFRFFKLDLDHVARYNITSEYIVKTC